MAFVKEFEYDIFVSFASSDNESPAGGDIGWVTTLVQRLKDRLEDLLEHSLSIFMDAASDQRSEQALKAAVLLVVQSPAYDNSDAYLEERRRFQSRNGDAKNAVFIVELENLDRTAQPPAPFDAEQCLRYSFWTDDRVLRHERRLDLADGESDAMFDTLAYELADELELLQERDVIDYTFDVTEGYGHSKESPPSSGSPAPSATDPASSMDDLQFSAFCPKHVSPGDAIILEVIAYLRDQREQALQMARAKSIEVGKKAGVLIERNTDICVHVQCPGLTIEDNVDVIRWGGKVANAAFIVEVPQTAEEKTYIGVVRFVVQAVQIAKLPFTVTVAARTDSADPRDDRTSTRPIRSVFASYASQDRIEVLQWKRGAESVGVDVFVDVATLHQGDDWSTRLREEITRRDLFCLFWSDAASQSEWVEKEWRQALDEKGCDFIQPVPLVDPRKTPPPPLLGKCLHFEDMSRIAIAYEQLWRG